MIAAAAVAKDFGKTVVDYALGVIYYPDDEWVVPNPIYGYKK